MGHDCIEYEGHRELFNDFDLWTLRHFFIEEARSALARHSGDDTAALCRFFEAWRWVGPGVFIGTDFSRFVSGSRPRWDLLLQLLQQAGDRISAFGEVIPLEYLTAHVSTRTACFTRAQPTRLYLLCIGRICTLLSKHEPHAAQPCAPASPA